MEMYADEDARGGVLEPEGIVGIKFRKERQIETMARLDPTYKELKASLAQEGLTREQQAEIKTKMTEREQLLLPVYSQISLQYADLHDRAGRMEAKGTIRQALRWQNARRFFYWRLRRRLNEEYILKRMAAASASTEISNRAMNLETLKAWCGLPHFDKNDMEVACWYEENRKEIHTKVEALKREGVAFEVATLLRKDKEAGFRGLQQMLSMMPTAEKEEVLRMLNKA